ncbi:hypothetical protein ACFOG5_22340 [Pedobacter fastidiosus]|uniref:Uncharacterized protein n=1 Tax=Pedobacter fastidiosus TaxID=2765361 RepID=A0ABR7KNS7_9SPHI|nr:hypothetical protein [Pedobacter fastidiosus]MBC6109520.1 hypothetical protein [Pedobacter fastidiosus]
MITNLKSTQFLHASLIIFLLATMFSCNSESSKKKTDEVKSQNADEYFSVEINGKLWQAFPSKEFKEYNLSYKELDKQFSIFAEAEDGSRMDLSFHSKKGIAVGSYPSTKNDNGTQSGIFYFPEAKSSDKELASTTFDVPVQENAVQITKVDKSNKDAYVIEGTFSPIMYALYETNPERSTKFTGGKFRVIYRPSSMDPAF